MAEEVNVLLQEGKADQNQDLTKAGRKEILQGADSTGNFFYLTTQRNPPAFRQGVATLFRSVDGPEGGHP